MVLAKVDFEETIAQGCLHPLDCQLQKKDQKAKLRRQGRRATSCSRRAPTCESRSEVDARSNEPPVSTASSRNVTAEPLKQHKRV